MEVRYCTQNKPKSRNACSVVLECSSFVIKFFSHPNLGCHWANVNDRQGKKKRTFVTPRWPDIFFACGVLDFPCAQQVFCSHSAVGWNFHLEAKIFSCWYFCTIQNSVNSKQCCAVEWPRIKRDFLLMSLFLSAYIFGLDVRVMIVQNFTVTHARNRLFHEKETLH